MSIAVEPKEGMQQIVQFGVEYADGQIEWASNDHPRGSQVVKPKWAAKEPGLGVFHIEPHHDGIATGFPALVQLYRKKMTEAGAEVKPPRRLSRVVFIIGAEFSREAVPE